MASKFLRPKRSSPSYARPNGTGGSGHTVLELLLAMTIMLIGGTIAFSTANGARRLYDADAARNDLNQNLRSAVDMMTSEVRQTGERLPADFPALELVDNVAGDRLTVRRHLVESTLLSCTDLAISDVRIFVALPAGTGNCSIVADNDTDGFPDNIQQYREYRLEHGQGASPVVLPNGYIYDPVTRQGEFFAFENEDVDGGTGQWFLEISGGGLANAYPSANQPRVYVLDEMRFDLSSGTIELRRDGAAGSPLAVVDSIVDFQVTLELADSTIVSAFSSSDDWSSIQTVQLQMTGQANVRKRTITRTLTADVFPRNILSY